MYISKLLKLDWDALEDKDLPPPIKPKIAPMKPMSSGAPFRHSDTHLEPHLDSSTIAQFNFMAVEDNIPEDTKLSEVEEAGVLEAPNPSLSGSGFKLCEQADSAVSVGVAPQPKDSSQDLLWF